MIASNAARASAESQGAGSFVLGFERFGFFVGRARAITRCTVVRLHLAPSRAESFSAFSVSAISRTEVRPSHVFFSDGSEHKLGVPNRVLCFVELEYDDDVRLASLERVLAALAHAKETDEWHDDDHWLAFFDEAARSKFWWPTDAERADHLRRWFATPVETRFTDPSLETPWDFGSMIDAFRDGDYRLIGLRRLRPAVARIEYEPFGDPYGGTGCMVALVEAFGFRVSQIRD